MGSAVPYFASSLTTEVGQGSQALPAHSSTPSLSHSAGAVFLPTDGWGHWLGEAEAGGEGVGRGERKPQILCLLPGLW